MKERVCFRLDLDLLDRVREAGDKRQWNLSETLAEVVLIGVETLERGHKLSDFRLAAVIETMLVMLDYVGTEIVGEEKIRKAPMIAQQRMVQFHEKV